MPDSAPSQPPALHASARSRSGDARGAAALHTGRSWEEACDGALAGLDGTPRPSLVVAFVDSIFQAHYEEILGRIRERLGEPRVIGCTGQAVIGPGVEAEQAPSVSLLAIEAPGATLTPLRIDPQTTTPADFERLAAAGTNSWLLFADPFSINTENLVAGLQERYPELMLLGGMASAHDNEAGTAVFLDGAVHREGAVMLGLEGIEVHPIVAQGAEPLGQPWTITDCERNIVRGIGSRPAVEVLMETLAELDEETRARAQANLLVGLAMDEYEEEHTRGSYLIRNIMGANRDEGWIAINAVPRLGQTFQFQFRDAAAADADLRQHLDAFKAAGHGDRVLGALCCSCNGRGVGLFGTPHHDAAALAAALDQVPTAGFFCNGEIGPVGGANFLHGFTASIAVLTTPGDVAADSP